MSKAKVYIVAFAFFLPFSIFCQTSKKGSISPEEKKRLENQFKALKTFYIDDDGVVVYTLPADKGGAKTMKPNDSKTIPEVKVNKEIINTKDSISGSLSTENSSKPISEILAIIDTHLVDADKSSAVTVVDSTSNIVATTDKKVQGDIRKTKSTANAKTNDKKQPIKPVDSVAKVNGNVEAKSSQPVNNTTQPVFRRRTSSLKSLEQAAMAVDVLLDELLTQQAQMNTPMNVGNSSISKRAVQPVDGSLRKSTTNNIDPTELENSVDDKFGVEPTYYINGVEVDKAEVNKLRPRDILKREIRVRNTVSGNPNGELWIETR